MSTWKVRARKLRTRVRRWGLLRTLYQIIMDQAGTRLGLFYAHVYVRPLSSSEPAPVGIRACLADYETLIPYARTPDYHLSAGFLRSAFDRGDACVVTFSGERLVAYGWVAYSTVPHSSDVWVEFPPGYRYTYKSFTDPEFRGRHLRGSFGALATRDRSENATRTICFIESHNFASRRAERRAGGIMVGSAGYLPLAGRTRTFRSPGAARAGFRFQARPSTPCNQDREGFQE